MRSNRSNRILWLFLPLLLLASCKGGKEAQAPEPYWLGADISFARSQEARGFQYKNKAGEPRECTALMKELGLNAISLRVWVNPKPWVRPGQPVPDPSDPAYHIGLCDKEDVLAKALVAKELGMEILLSFHYSDTWSDPKAQPIPAAWM
ncbi:MAG: glycosyl hydrolase 53 family protein, partial [Bacteroidales bacterium]|nr:glycosyl hydrolase 53 family protein [Bacteroidales bacterium]MBR4688639.1 glycosyl hydrolase 53 family protein [Bacteroidales bacterium]